MAHAPTLMTAVQERLMFFRFNYSKRKLTLLQKKIQKDGDAGEDEVQTAEKELDGVTKKYVEQIDSLVERKEAELMEV